MGFKSNLLLLVFIIVLFAAFGQQDCHGMIKRLQDKQEVLMRQAEQQTRIEPNASREIKQEILERIETPTDMEQPDSPLFPIREEIGMLLAKEDVKPEEIAAVKERLESLEAEGQIDETERVEYENLRSNVNVAYEFTNTIDKLKQSKVTMDELDTNFKQLGGQYYFSFYGNLVLILGLITKCGNIINWRLDRKLKQLDIDIKEAELNKQNVNN